MSADIIDITSLSPRKVNKKQRIGVIIQARMTSKRFPGKSMADLLGAPVIAHVIERARKIKLLSEVILAVPDTPESEPLVQIAQATGISNFCGPEDDVLKRYFEAAMFFNLDVIIRITGDCPFINVEICDKVLDLFLWRKLDYCSNVYPNRTYPKGMDCEVFTMDTLHATHVIATDLHDREHVTPYMQRENDIKKACLAQRHDKSHLDYCIDYPEDIKRVSEIVKGRVSVSMARVKKETENV